MLQSSASRCQQLWCVRPAFSLIADSFGNDEHKKFLSTVPVTEAVWIQWQKTEFHDSMIISVNAMIIRSADQCILEFVFCISVLYSHQITQKSCTFDAFKPF